MTSYNSLSLLVNGLALALSIAFLIIVIWQDGRKELNQFFALFLFSVVVWNSGSLLYALSILIEINTPELLVLPSILLEVGFTTSSFALYVLTAILVGVHTRRFRFVALFTLCLVCGYQLFIALGSLQDSFPAVNVNTPYRFQTLSSLYYLSFNAISVYLLWRYRNKLESNPLLLGMMGFAISQAVGFLNPSLGINAIATAIAGICTLIISFSFLRREIIRPLQEQTAQIETMHRVSLAISSQIQMETVLNQIVTQATVWFSADAACMFLLSDRSLEIVALHNLPKRLMGYQLATGVGLAGKVVQTKQSILVVNYDRDWKGAEDIPFARETFGSVMCVPLIYRGEIIGVLTVIAGRNGKLFQSPDVHLLELLAAQAAVAISHGRLFKDQKLLTEQLEVAHDQLDAVLRSTENPVIAVDRKLRVVFANIAAKRLLNVEQIQGSRITDLVSSSFLPSQVFHALRNLRKYGVHSYEINDEKHVYTCHVAPLANPQKVGWVAVLNDITQLKELDTLKSDMIRMTSHDLKNPLQAAMANLELLTDDLSVVPNPEFLTTVQVIAKQLDRMNRIIGGILDLERIRGSRLLTESCEVHTIVSTVIDELRPSADSKQISISIDLDDKLPSFQGDMQQFTRAISNLVENAIKFSNLGSTIWIRSFQRNDEIVITIQDEGIGISSDLHDQVFERFWRGGQKGQKGAEHISGTGLGLSLAKTIIERHQGKIIFASQSGSGTTFEITLPVGIVNA
jgi:signal transduction histidine kinase